MTERPRENERGAFLRRVQKRLGWSASRLAAAAEKTSGKGRPSGAASYSEKTIRTAVRTGKSISDDVYLAIADALFEGLPEHDPARETLRHILELPGWSGPAPNHLKRLADFVEKVVRKQFGLRPGLVIVLLVLSIVVGLVSAAVWTIIYGHLGGSTEPHGVVAMLWFTSTAGPLLVVLGFGLYWGRQEKAGSVEVELGFILLGGALGSWVFYSVPVAGHIGVRAWLSSWPARPREFVLVVIWSLLIVSAGFGAQQFIAKYCQGRPALRRYLWRRLLLAVVVTWIPVWIFVARFGDTQEGARGVLAGTFLRLGLALAVLYQPSVEPGQEEREALTNSASHRLA